MSIDIETSFFGAAVDISKQLVTLLYPDLTSTKNAWDVICKIDMPVANARRTFLYQHGTSGEKVPTANEISFNNVSTNFNPTGRWVDASVNAEDNANNNASTRSGAATNGGPTRVAGDQPGQEGLADDATANNPPAPCHYDADDISSAELNWDLGNRYVYSLAGNRPYMRHILNNASDISLTAYIKGDLETQLVSNIKAQLTIDSSGTVGGDEAGNWIYSIQAQIYNAIANNSNGVQRLEEDISNGVGFSDASGLPLRADDTISMYAAFDLSLVPFTFETVSDGSAAAIIPQTLCSYRGTTSGANNESLEVGDDGFIYDSYAITDSGGYQPLLKQPDNTVYTGTGFVVYKIVINLTEA